MNKLQSIFAFSLSFDYLREYKSNDDYILELSRFYASLLSTLRWGIALNVLLCIILIKLYPDYAEHGGPTVMFVCFVSTILVAYVRSFFIKVDRDYYDLHLKELRAKPKKEKRSMIVKYNLFLVLFQFLALVPFLILIFCY